MTKVIVFEGVDGSGKSTQLNLLNKYLVDNNFNVLYTAEPYGKIGQHKIKDLIKSDKNMKEWVKLQLFFMSRKMNVEECILPNFDDYDFILIDRYKLSTIVYQHNFLPYIEKFHNDMDKRLPIDFTLIFDCDSDIILERLKNRKQNDALDSFNKNEIEELRERYLCYEKYLGFDFENKTAIIDADLDMDLVNKLVIKVLQRNNILDKK